jgi:hypothetical protein
MRLTLLRAQMQSMRALPPLARMLLGPVRSHFPKQLGLKNRIQPRGVESLPQPTPDLFAQAGAILAKRAAHGGAPDSELATIVARSSAQAARLVVEGAPSASAEQSGQRHGP